MSAPGPVRPEVQASPYFLLGKIEGILEGEKDGDCTPEQAITLVRRVMEEWKAAEESLMRPRPN